MIPRTATRLALMWALGAALAVPTRAQTTAYTLSAGAEYRTGCFAPPCTCGPIQLPMTGTMALVRKPDSAQFANYDVIGVVWRVQFNDAVLSITGSGTYRVGGTGTLRQQLTLDLSVGGGPVRHFDSGLVAGGGNFPRLDVGISLHGQTPCADTLLIVRAGPGGTTDVAGGGVSVQSLAPNPFRTGTRLLFTVSEAGPVRLSIHDAAGRCVRTLVAGDPLEPARTRSSGMAARPTGVCARRAATSSASRPAGGRNR